MKNANDFSFCEGVTHGGGDADRNVVFGDSRWGVNDSGIRSYGASPYSTRSPFAAKIIAQLEKDPPGAAMDVAGGSNGVALQDLFKVGAIDRGLVTNLQDLRNRRTKRNKKLDHIAGDIILPKTWQKMSDWRQEYASEGLSAILHRPYGALQCLPVQFYEGALSTLLEWMRPGGVGLFQIPDMLPDSDLGRICSDLAGRQDIEEVFCPPGSKTALIYKRG